MNWSAKVVSEKKLHQTQMEVNLVIFPFQLKIKASFGNAQPCFRYCPFIASDSVGTSSLRGRNSVIVRPQRLPWKVAAMDFKSRCNCRMLNPPGAEEYLTPRLENLPGGVFACEHACVCVYTCVFFYFYVHIYI